MVVSLDDGNFALFEVETLNSRFIFYDNDWLRYKILNYSHES